MKTTELFVEQVIIGFMMVILVGLPWVPDLVGMAPRVNAVLGIAGGAVGLGMAYLLGIVGDRMADTLTEGLDRHHRLRFGLERLLKQIDSLSDLAPDRRAWSDPFPEDQLRLAGLRDAPAIVDWLDYHRSRVRLTRALAVWLPGLTVSAVVAGARLEELPGPVSSLAWVLMIAAIYGVVSWSVSRRLSARRQASREQSGPTWRLAPRTDHPAAYQYGIAHGFVDQSLASQEQRRRTLESVFLADPALRGAMALLALALGLGMSTARPLLIGIAVVGALFTVLSGWSWWRISWTYRTYLLFSGAKPRTS